MSNGESVLSPLLGIYYRTEWSERGLPEPERLLPIARLPDLQEAVSEVARSIDRKAEDTLTAGRIALAQLFRRAPEAAAEVKSWEEYVSELLEAFSIIEGWDDKAARDLLRVRERERAPDARFFAVFNHSLFGSITPYRVRRYALSWSYAHRVTDVTVRVEVQRDLMDFRHCVDPRRWARDLPNTWKRAAPVTEPAVPDREAYWPDDEAMGGAHVPLTDFFENAVWITPSMLLSDYRNLLKVIIDLRQPSGTPELRNGIGFTYSQRECLTSKLLGFGTLLGGIDVDEGFGRAYPTEEAGWCALDARKRARFSLPHGPLNHLYNGLAAVWLLLFIEWLVLSGTQVPPPAPPPPAPPTPPPT